MPGRLTRQLVASLALSAALLPALGGDALSAPGAASCAKVRADARTGTPEDVAVLFITSAVLRLSPDCAYDLVTPALLGKRTRKAFAAGRGVAPYATSRPRAVTFRLAPRVRLLDQVGSWITLAAPDRKPRTFEIVLRKRGGRWLVDYWAHAVGFD